MSFFNYLQIGLCVLLSLQFAQGSQSLRVLTSTVTSSVKCELKCTKWDLVCTKPPSKCYSPKLPYVVCNPADYPRYPNSVNDVVAIVKEANAKGLAVKAFGSQLGQSDLICTEGIPVGISGLQTRKINADNTATFGAGVTLYDAAEFLRNNGRAFETLSIYGGITMSGVILTGGQGNSLKYDSTIASQVVAMTIINSKGAIQVISCPEELKAFSVSLGLLGILVEVTIRTVKLYKVQAHNYIECDSVLTNGKAIKWAAVTDELSLYWYPSSEEVVVSNRTFVCADTPGNAHSNDFLSSIYAKFARIFSKAKETAFDLTSSTCAKANAVGYDILRAIEHFTKLSLVEQAPEMLPIYTEDGVNTQNPAVGFAHLISSPICSSTPQGPNKNACPYSHGDNSITTLDNEFSIPITDLADFVKMVKDLEKKTPVAFPLLGIRISFSARSNIFLSTAFGRPSANIEFRMLNRKSLFSDPSGSLAAYQTIIQILINQFKARASWGKGGLASHSAASIDLKMDKCARNSFIEAMNKNDPKGTFINKMGLRLKGTGTKSDVNPSATRCALLGSCFCSLDSDCGVHQTCSTLSGCSYRVCRTKNEDYQCHANSKLPPLKDLVKYLEVDVPQLAAAVLSKC